MAEPNVDNIIETGAKQFDKCGRYKKIRCHCNVVQLYQNVILHNIKKQDVTKK